MSFESREGAKTESQSHNRSKKFTQNHTRISSGAPWKIHYHHSTAQHSTAQHSAAGASAAGGLHLELAKGAEYNDVVHPCLALKQDLLVHRKGIHPCEDPLDGGCAARARSVQQLPFSF